MKNSILLTAAVLAFAPAIAQETAPAAPAAPAEAAAAPADAGKFEAAARNLMNCIKELNDALQGVKDTASADAAAPKVKADLERIFAIEKSLDIDNMPDSIAIKLQAEFRFTLGGFMSSMLINASYLEENQCYGSDALMKAMRRLMIGGEEEPAESPAA